MCDELLENIDNGRLSGILFLDLSKAFDLVDHRTLLKKLSLYGVEINGLNWFKSFLSNRSQVVSYMGKTSNVQKVTVGVPQGSLLGPLLFTIFINDLPFTLLNSQLDMYADDQTLLTSGISVPHVNDSLQNDVILSNNWIQSNGMMINEGKTKAMLVGSRQKIKDVNISSEQLDISINNKQISCVTSEKMLGPTLDNFYFMG